MLNEAEQKFLLETLEDLPFKYKSDIFLTLNAYEQPHRHYHNLTHIHHLLETYKWYCREASALVHPFMIASIWFHDLIYNPTKSDNEMRSAEIMTNMLGNLGDMNTAELIIIGTKTHVPVKDYDTTAYFSRIFFDMDLKILSEARNVYERYARGIRKEYGFVNDDDYLDGRTKVLRSFLERDKIYCSYHFEQFEEAARENIEWELDMMGNRKGFFNE